MHIRKLKFQGSLGHRLAAQLDLPVDGEPHACALFAHCFTCTKDIKAAYHISQALTRAGLAVLRFDFTGLGQSEGEFAETGFRSNVADLVAAAKYMGRELEAPQLLIGHSLGGAAVLQAAAQIPSVRAVVTLGAPAELGHVRRLLTGAEATIREQGSAEVEIEGRRFRIGQALLDDLDQTRMREIIAGLRKALLILHAPRDQVVGVDNAAAIFTAARHPKSYVSLDSADHLLSDPADARYAAQVIAAWASRYLQLEEPSADSPDTPEGQVVVRTGAEGFTSEVHAGRHSLVADEPQRVGGADQGPSPYGYLLAALGACTTMTLRMYADRKHWPLEAAEVRLRHRKMHASDCAVCDTQDGKIDHIERVLHLEGPLDAEQRQRLVEIADRCPVHRTLHGEIHVATSLAE